MRLFEVIYTKRVRGFHQGFQTPRNRWKDEAGGRVLLLFRDDFSNETIKKYAAIPFLAIVLPKWKNNNLCSDAILPYYVTLLRHSWLINCFGVVGVWPTTPLIWDQNHVRSQIKTHKIFIWMFIGYQGSCMWPKYASFIGCCPHEWLMTLKNKKHCQFCFFFFQKNHCRQSWQEFCSRLYA